MYKSMHRTGSITAVLLALAVSATSGCSEGDTALTPVTGAAQAKLKATQEGKSFNLRENLPFIESIDAAEVFVQKLEKPTQLEEDTALHLRMLRTANPELQESLVRVVGQPENPLVLFRTDALVELGRITKSPGPDFFTAFVRLDAKEIERRLNNEEKLLGGKFGKTEETMIVFEGRTPVAVSTGVRFDREAFDSFLPVPLGTCPVFPLSNETAWGESLLITDPAVVQDPARTWDPCTGAGTQGGVWTFAHLMREMAQGSGSTPEDFVLEWLTLWLNDYTVNSDTVAHRRSEMYNQVIEPWAAASGVFSSLVFDGIDNRFEVDLSGPLDLDIAPFRLLSIVNRIDLGGTVDGPSGYGGGSTSRPVDAGELRFVFGVTEPSPWGAGTEGTCNLKPFTVIFEYGVPITGCSNVVQWAQDWTTLNTFGGFTDAYRTHLASMTQSVVVHGAAPGKGNDNALNQIRTNEIALASPWELREFTLTDENPGAGTDTPSNGLLRSHSVAQTPDDTAHSAFNDPDVDLYVFDQVLAGVDTTGGNCSAAYTVPHGYNGSAFRGGNSQVSPTHWEAVSVDPLVFDEVCARHQFSVNTCNGCHSGDTSTSFTHISPTSGIPAGLSNFLTGGGAGMAWSVADSQFGSPSWSFADLDRRFERLYEIAQCTECSGVIPFPGFLDFIGEVAGVIPIDPLVPIRTKFKIGPITKFETLQRILDSRAEFAKPELIESAPIDFVRPVETNAH